MLAPTTTAARAAGRPLVVGGENPGGHGGVWLDSERAQLADSHRRVSLLPTVNSHFSRTAMVEVYHPLFRLAFKKCCSVTIGM